MLFHCWFSWRWLNLFLILSCYLRLGSLFTVPLLAACYCFETMSMLLPASYLRSGHCLQFLYHYLAFVWVPVFICSLLALVWDPDNVYSFIDSIPTTIFDWTSLPIWLPLVLTISILFTHLLFEMWPLLTVSMLIPEFSLRPGYSLEFLTRLTFETWSLFSISMLVPSYYVQYSHCNYLQFMC